MTDPRPTGLRRLVTDGRAWIGLRGTVTAAVLAGCGAPTQSPGAPRETQYALHSIDLNAPPWFLGAVGLDSVFLDAESLTLRSDSIAGFRRTIRTLRFGTPAQSATQEFALRFSIRGDSIVLTDGLVCVTFPCPRTDLRGVISEHGVRLVQGAPPARLLTYHRMTALRGAP